MKMQGRETLIAVCCYQGDAAQVRSQMPSHTRTGHPVVILSPEDSRVVIPGHINRHAGRAAYIGPESLSRQLHYFEILLGYPHEYFLLHDSDSMMLSAEVPERLYQESEETIWSNEIEEPRPHASPYPKLAFQPPYFLDRDSMARMLNVAGKVPVHPITPYVDWFMNALSFEAGLKHRAFTELEHESRGPKPWQMTPWSQLDYRIRFMGTNFVHPIKTQSQVQLCREARKFYES